MFPHFSKTFQDQEITKPSKSGGKIILTFYIEFLVINVNCILYFFFPFPLYCKVLIPYTGNPTAFDWSAVSLQNVLSSFGIHGNTFKYCKFLKSMQLSAYSTLKQFFWGMLKQFIGTLDNIWMCTALFLSYY